MTHRCYMNTKNDEEPFNWCYDNIGSWEDGKWIRWRHEGESLFRFEIEADYLLFILKFGHLLI